MTGGGAVIVGANNCLPQLRQNPSAGAAGVPHCGQTVVFNVGSLIILDFSTYPSGAAWQSRTSDSKYVFSQMLLSRKKTKVNRPTPGAQTSCLHLFLKLTRLAARLQTRRERRHPVCKASAEVNPERKSTTSCLRSQHDSCSRGTRLSRP